MPGIYRPGGTGVPEGGGSAQGGGAPVAPTNVVVQAPAGPRGTVGVPGGKSAPAPMTPAQVRSMQQFLNNHGFQVAQDGILGPQTKAAAQAFRTNHKGGAQWSAKNGVGTHKGVVGAASGTPPAVVTGAGAGSGAGGGGTPPGTGTDAFTTLLTALLAKSGSVGSTLDPTAFGNAAAAPDMAAVGVDGQQIKANPLQENQSQQDISSWYGLDPNASSYKLSVLGRLAQAKTGDAAAATGASSNVADIAQALAGSIGGSANDGSGMVAAAGVNDAGTLAALGQANTDYERNMSPLLAAEATGAKTSEKATNQATLLQLLQQQATDQGKAQADRATGVASAVGQNNGVEQQRFADQGNLLSTLAQMSAVDPTNQNLKNALLQAQIAKTRAQATATTSKIGAAGAVPKVDLAKAGNSIAGLLGVGTDHVLPQGTSQTKLVYTIGSQLQGMGLKKGTPEYQRMGQTLLAMFKNADGTPIVAPASWFGPKS